MVALYCIQLVEVGGVHTVHVICTLESLHIFELLDRVTFTSSTPSFKTTVSFCYN